MAYAPDTIRMAVCIDTTHVYTIKQLMSALEKRTCVYCEGVAPYLDVCTLERRFLDAGGPCFDTSWKFNHKFLPILVDNDGHALCYVPSSLKERITRDILSFRALPGTYTYCPTFTISPGNNVFYDVESLADVIGPHKIDIYADTSSVDYRAKSKLTMVYAPWLETATIPRSPA
ncbi:hypothetical protein BU23DRAFT_202711 [Bimuria novae-zelandiae CBS 107.79]|uniref:Uncharacterized protein n=1 Tax=Bimuria novae-zelandiae CBS 107.79 TaxID=1447943 RepID=A0A6A5V172_9PLEO|nr:hypothetical protein BU23DRAFT_202711 [Bimuria novae-zelandiae CBS 107.79]